MIPPSELAPNPPMPSLIERLRREIRGEVLDDPLSLGLYATDASIYQIMPLAVVLPLDRADALRAVRIAGEGGRRSCRAAPAPAFPVRPWPGRW